MKQFKSIVLVPLLLVSAQAQVNKVVSLVSRAGAAAGLCPGVAAELDLNTQAPGAPLFISIGGKNVPITSRPVCCGFPTGVTDEADVQLPWDAPVGNTSLTVTQNGVTSSPFPVTLTQYCPAIVGNHDGSQNSGFFSFESTFAGASPYVNTRLPATPGETVFMGAVGLGPTAPLVPPGLGIVANVSTMPAVTVGGQPAQVLSAGLAYESINVSGSKYSFIGSDFAYPGFYQVIFNVPSGLTDGSYPVVITQGGFSSPPVNMVVGHTDPAGRPSVLAVTNAANFHVYEEYNPAPGTVVTVYASNLPPVTQTSGIFPATSYQGIQVMWGSTPLPIYSIDGPNNQINVGLPANRQGANLNIVTPAGESWYSYLVSENAKVLDDVGVIRLADGASGVFQLNGSAALAMSASLAAQYHLPACAGQPSGTLCAQRAKAGDAVTMYLVGGGLATPGGDPNGAPLALGQLAPADGSVLYTMVNPLQITVGGVAVTGEAFAGIAPGTAAEYQVNFTIPSGVPSGDTVPVIVTGQSSVDTVSIAIQ